MSRLLSGEEGAVVAEWWSKSFLFCFFEKEADLFTRVFMQAPKAVLNWVDHFFCKNTNNAFFFFFFSFF